jgi:hypothetical protein
MWNKMTGRFIVWGSGGSNLPARITVVENNDLRARISIRPQNKLTGRFDVVDRPLDTYTFQPIKDSTIRSSVPTLNYGSENSMLIGFDSNSNEKFRSLIEFDISSLPTGKDFKRAVLKLQNSYSPVDISISIYVSEDRWAEKDVTWSNQPRSGIKVAEYTILAHQTETAIDISSIVQKWYDKTVTNYGLYIIATNEDTPGLTQFGTRESLTPPVLEVSFYKEVSSAGVAKLPSSITVRVAGESSLRSTIRVNSKNLREAIPAVIAIHKKSGDSSLPAVLQVKGRGFQNLNGSVTILKKDGSSDLPSSIKILKHEYLHASLTINKKNGNNDLPARLSIKFNEYLPSYLEIQRKNSQSDLPARIVIIGKVSLPSKLIIPWRSNLPSRIRVQYKNDLPATIRVNSNFLNARIAVRGYANSELPSSLTVRVKYFSDLRSRIMIVRQGDQEDFGYVFII